ncbi:MAG: hypothetical protein ACREA0_30745, partial [bacterium]
ISAAHGEYWFKMDIHDRYGDRFVSDIMLHLSARDADVVGKPPRYYTFAGEPLIYDGAPANTPELCVLSAEELGRGKICLNGNSLAGKKAVGPHVRFADTLHATPDTAFALHLGRNDLEVLILDPLNLVTVRRPDREDHTLVSETGELKSRVQPLENLVEGVFI